MIKATIIVVVTVWTIRSGWTELLQLSGMEPPALAQAAGRILLQLARTMGVVLIVLGLVDYAVRYRRFEQMLRITPAERRQDQRATEGDLVSRDQRRRLARAWRGDVPELLAGASLVLLGSGGLTLVLSGGPPPRRVTVRSVARGVSGLRLRRSAESMHVPLLDAPRLARRLARRPVPASPLAAEILAELAAVWPPP
jgi:flagellar biosynthetic protein FlhB